MHTAAGKAALFHEIRFHPEWRDRKAEFELIITLWLELQGIPSPPPFSFFFFLLKIIKLDEARYLSSELFHSPISKEIKSSNNFMQNLVLCASGSVANLTITNNSLVFQSFNYLFFNFFFFFRGKKNLSAGRQFGFPRHPPPAKSRFPSGWRPHLPVNICKLQLQTATGGSSALEWCHCLNSLSSGNIHILCPFPSFYNSGCGGVKIFQFWVKEL